MKPSLAVVCCSVLAWSYALRQDTESGSDVHQDNGSQLTSQEEGDVSEDRSSRQAFLYQEYQSTTTLPLIVLRSYCLKPRGTFPHPSDCSKYLDCWDGRVLEKSCPDGLVFSDLPGGFCDFAVYVDCGNRSSTDDQVVPEQTTPSSILTFVPDLTHLGKGFYLFVIDKKVTWQEARNFCQQQGLSLVTITDKEEDDFIIKKINEIERPHPFTPGPPGSGLYWIGANDENKEGQFKWTGTGNDVTYSNWLPQQPDNWQGEENCVHYWRLNGRIMWNDAACSLQMRFVCEWNKQ